MNGESYRLIEIGDPQQAGTTIAAVNMRSEYDKERNLQKYLELIAIAASPAPLAVAARTSRGPGVAWP